MKLRTTEHRAKSNKITQFLTNRGGFKKPYQNNNKSVNPIKKSNFGREFLEGF